MRKRDIFSSLLLFLVSAAYTAGSFGYPIWDRFGPGPGFFPLVLGFLLCVLSGVLLLVRAVKPGPSGQCLTASDSLRLQEIGKSLIYLGAILCFYLFFNRVGSLLTIFFFMMVVLVFMNRRPVKLSLSVSLLSVVLVYVVFVRILGVPLPGGLLKNVIRFY
jgi:putative tricarboxylic transport membrane protein